MPDRVSGGSQMETVFSFVQKLTDRAAITANAAGTLVVLALVLLVNYDVVARGLFNRPFLGAVEVVQFSMVLIVFLQLPDVVRVNRLTRSDGFLVLLDTRAPRAALWLRRAIDTVSLVFMGLIAVAIFPEFVEMWHTRDYFGIPGVFTAPWWPIKLVIFVSSALACAIFLLKLPAPGQAAKTRAPDQEDLG